MFDTANAIAILVVTGLCLTWLSRKLGLKVTLARILALWVFGAILAYLSGEGFLLYVGIIGMGAATALFFFDLFVTRPKAASDAEFQKIVQNASLGILNEDGAHTLFQKATNYETKGKTDDAIALYEILVRSNTSFAADAQSCLKNLRRDAKGRRDVL
jgi:hypothetical protein